MPGRPGAPPSRAAGGRGGRLSPGVLGAAGARSPPGAGAGRRPMPWLGANGLLPGRGVPPGLPTGRGAGDGAFGRGRRRGRRGLGLGRRGDGLLGDGSGLGARSRAARTRRRCGWGSRQVPRRQARRVPPRRVPRRGRLGDRGDDGLRSGLRCVLGRGLRGGRLAGRCLGGGRRGCGGRGLLGLQLVAVLLAETHLRRQLDGRARRLDELTHLLELLENELALDVELFGEFVNSGLSHVSPSGRRPGSSSVLGGDCDR